MAVAGILVLAVYAATLPLNGGTGPTTSRQPGADGSPGGQRAPDFVNADGSPALVALDGRPIRIADFTGRPLWIVFWATWCAPCQAEAAEINAVYHAHASDGLAVLAIDVQEPTAAVGQFVAERGLDYPIGLDATAATQALYGANGLPSHVFVGRDGVIQVRYAGQLTASLMESHVSALLAR